MFEIRTVPGADTRFRATVEAALAAASPDARERPERLHAALPAVLEVLRDRYPGAWARVQDPLASIEGRPVVYVFRDEAQGRDPDEWVLPPLPKGERWRRR